MISKTDTSEKPVDHTRHEERAKPSSAKAAQSPLTNYLQRNVRVLMALNAVSVAVTILLFVGLFFSWSATSELNQIRQQLAGLEQFEKRISGNVNLMNTGIQSRLSRIDQRIGQIQSGVRLMRIERGDQDIPIDKLKTVIDEDIDFFHSSTAAVMFSPALSAQTSGRFETASNVPRVTISQSSDQADGSALFRRIVTPDGKVRYEKR